MPKNAIERARVREICEVIVSGIQPLQNIGLLNYLGNERRKEWTNHWIIRGFTGKRINFSVLEKTKKSNFPTEEIYNIFMYNKNLKTFLAVEKLLHTRAGKYCVGDQITLADCCLIPQLFNARTYKVDLRPFSTILKVDENLRDHSAFVKAHPNNQPDCPPEAKL